MYETMIAGDGNGVMECCGADETENEGLRHTYTPKALWVFQYTLTVLI